MAADHDELLGLVNKIDTKLDTINQNFNDYRVAVEGRLTKIETTADHRAGAVGAITGVISGIITAVIASIITPKT